eukprot:CAMPEP_0115084286 /NCGR_PEP_ID=MMETSP0227-20121206/21149_1 /TAXON_ID=89957 /ORGANISM="Polarella glacialis, Strain CCMP 1383" /LENGTH=87 /DNA_ID=CAMNT_0002473023 /DNA_START=122 /DNA_END=382 /DNA_ORIENTATION=+
MSAAFNQIDANHDGVISRAEFDAMMGGGAQAVTYSAPVATSGYSYGAPAATSSYMTAAAPTSYAAPAASYMTAPPVYMTAPAEPTYA